MKDIRGAHAAQVRSTLYRVFGLPVLTLTNRKKNAKEVLAWKQSTEVKRSYIKLYNDDMIESIAKQAFPTITEKDDELFYVTCIYTAAVCDIILNPKYPDVECSKKPLELRYRRFKVVF